MGALAFKLEPIGLYSLAIQTDLLPISPTAKPSFPEALNELTGLLLLPDTPVEAVECAQRVVDQFQGCVVVVFEPCGASVADNWTPRLQSSDFFPEFVAAVRARDWQQVVVLEHAIVPRIESSAAG
jgi:hypothetical protein